MPLETYFSPETLFVLLFDLNVLTINGFHAPKHYG